MVVSALVQPTPTIERVCRVLVAVACAWFAFTAVWGIATIPAGGHIGSAPCAAAMIGEAELKWHSLYPLWDWYGLTDPGPTAAYTHHPFGVMWASALMIKLFGRHDFIVNFPAFVMSSLTPPLLYSTGKRAWGTLAGTATTLAFVVLPLTVGYSIFHSLEVMTIFGAVLAFYGHVHYQATGRTRFLVATAAGVIVSTSGDWVGYLIFGPLLAWMFLRAFALPSWMTPAVNKDRYTRWWAWAVALTVGTFFMWMALFQHINRIGEWLGAGDSRGGKDEMLLAAVLESRKTWIDFSFTPLAIFVGKLAFPIALARLVVRRRDEEAFSLAVLAGAVAQYVVFKRGADVHIFWPHYFGAYYAYAVGQLVATVESSSRFVAARVAPFHMRRIAGIAALVAIALTTLIIAPDGVRSLKIWRETGGRYNDKGSLFRSGADEIFVLKKIVAPHIHTGEVLGVHPAGGFGWEHQWAIKGLYENAEDPTPRYPMWVGRASAVGADHLKKLASQRHVRLYGDTIVITRGEPQAPVDAYSLNEHEPNLFQWIFTNNTEPVREIDAQPDPFTTWEWRYHLDQEPAIAPAAAPATLDEMRIMHNVALAKGDAAGAEQLREKIVAQLDRDHETHYAGDHELMGVRVEGGVKPKIVIWFVAGGPTANDTTFSVRSQIVKKAPLSLIPIDPTICEHAYPPPLSSKLWKKGFIYTFEATMNHRIGLERYFGAWSGGAPLHGTDASVDLAYVP